MSERKKNKPSRTVARTRKATEPAKRKKADPVALGDIAANLAADLVTELASDATPRTDVASDEGNGATRRQADWTMLSRAVLGEPEYTVNQVAQASGISRHTLGLLWSAMGFPPVPDDEAIFTIRDVAALELAARAQGPTPLDDPSVVQLTRTMGQALSRVADTETGLLPPVGEARDIALSEDVLNTTERIVGFMWRRHLLASLWRRSAAGEVGLEGEAPQVVGFADMVDFTTISQEIGEYRLAQLVARFETLVYDHIPAHHGRVVKMIGDEVLFLADEVGQGAEIALGLVESHERDDTLPQIRVGLAVGPTVEFQGDRFGPTVNLASRLVNFAKPATVLVSEHVAESLGGSSGFAVKKLGSKPKLKGFGRVTAFALKRAQAQQ